MQDSLKLEDNVWPELKNAVQDAVSFKQLIH